MAGLIIQIPKMADYWKSNPKYFCEVCKCWFANNKISIENHEKGLRHKGNIEKRLHETRRKAAVKEKEDEKVSETLEKIEKAAKAAYQRDKKSIVPRESSVVKAALEKEKKIKTGKLKKVAPPPPPSPWQQLLSPEGRIYYYHVLKGISQWECPPELKTSTAKSTPTPPVAMGTSKFGTFTKTAKGSIVPMGITHETISDNSIQGDWMRQMREHDEFLQKPFTELAAVADYYSTPTEDDDEGDEANLPPAKRFNPYGAWTTVSTRPQEVVVEDEDQENEEDDDDDDDDDSSQSDEDDEDECTFKEKSHPPQSTSLDQNEDNKTDDVTVGTFKGFSFKKPSTSRTNIKQRTSDW